MPFGAIFLGPLELFLGGLQGPYVGCQSTLVLEVQPYLVVFILAIFWAFFALFGPFGAIYGVGIVEIRNFTQLRQKILR